MNQYTTKGTLCLLAIIFGTMPVHAADAETVPYGLKKGRLQVCAAQSNCISTSSIKSLDKYGSPLIIPSSIDPEMAWKTLTAAGTDQLNLF